MERAQVVSHDRPGFLRIEKRGLDITQWLPQFIEEIGVSKSTKKTYSKVIRFFNDYLLEVGYKERNSPKIPTKTHINGYKDRLVSENKSTYTINLYMTVIKRYFNWLLEEGYCHEDITKQVRLKRTPQEYSKQTLTDDQVKRTITRDSFKTKLTKSQTERLGRRYKLDHEKTHKELLKEERDHTIYLILLLTGMRAIELVRADIGDIQKYRDFFVLKVQPKGHDSKDQIKPLPAQVLTALASYLELRGVNLEEDKDKPLIPSTKSTHNKQEASRLTTRSIRGIVKNHLKENLGKEIELANISTHSLRHSFATKLYNEEKDILVLQKALGHSSPTVSQRYAHNNLDDVIQATMSTANSFYK